MTKNKKAEKASPKKKYAKPKVTRHGSLAGLADKAVGLPITSCCLTQRMRRSLAATSAAAR